MIVRQVVFTVAVTSMFSLVYVSSAVKPFSQQALADLLAKSRANNARLGISGMLLYKNGGFMQVLEGEESAVRQLYAKIGESHAHRCMLVLLQQQQATRDFADWSMGFRDLNALDSYAVPGYCEFLNMDLTDPQFFCDPSNAQKLLLTFKKVQG